MRQVFFAIILTSHLPILATVAEAKRVMILPPEENPSSFSKAEVKWLAVRVGRALRECPGLENGASAEILIKDASDQALDSQAAEEGLQAALRGVGKPATLKIRINATLTFRERKKGSKKTATYTLKAQAFQESGKKICDRLHRTVKRNRS